MKKIIFLSCLALWTTTAFAQSAIDSRSPFECGKVLLAKVLNERGEQWSRISIQTNQFDYMDLQGTGTTQKLSKDGKEFIDSWDGKVFGGHPSWYQLEVGVITFKVKAELVERNGKLVKKHQTDGIIAAKFKITRHKYTGTPLQYRCDLKYLSLSHEKTRYELLEINKYE